MRDGRVRLLAIARLWPVVPGVIALVFAWASFGGGLVDDAYISLTYARQLVQGNGLVFHPALPPAEGYSNLLWTLLLALAMALGLPGASAATWLGLVFAGATVALVAREVGGRAGALVGVAIAASPIFGYWAGRGLEGSLLSFLLTLGVLRLGTPLGWLAFGLIGVTRVEGLAYGLLPLLHQLVTRPEARLLPSRRAIALWCGPGLTQLVFRLLAYGELLPSTAVAKSSGSWSAALGRGLSWLGSAIPLEPTLVLALGGLVMLAWRAPALRRSLWPAGVAVCGILVFSVSVGGDWMPYNRWLQPAIPLVWLAVGLGMAERPRWRLGLVSLAIGLGALHSGRGEGDKTAPRSWSLGAQVLSSGPSPIRLHPAHVFVVEWLPETEAVLMPDIGMLAWVTGNPVLDPQGLTWREVAENLAVDLGTPTGAAALESIRQTVRRLNPALVALVVQSKDGTARGPVATALIGSGRANPAWFAQGWSMWREQPYGSKEKLVFYLRKDIQPPSPSAALSRLTEASARVPNAPGLVLDRVRRLRQLGRAAEADALAQTTGARQGGTEERWTP